MKYALEVCLYRRSFRFVTATTSIVALIVAVCSAASIDPKPIGELIS